MRKVIFLSFAIIDIITLYPVSEFCCIYVSNTSINPTISNNKVYGNNAGGIQLNGDRYMGGTGIISNAKILGNIIFNNGKIGGAALNLDGVQFSKIYNNLLYDNQATGIAIFKGDGGDGSKNNKIYNNTVIMPKNSRWCILFKNESSNNTFFNNICINQDNYKGSIYIDKTSLAGFKSDYNALTPIFNIDGKQTIKNLSLWQKLTGNDINSLSVNSPHSLFNYKLKQFIPLKNSQLINSGDINTSSSHDILANKRKNTPDIGAFESKLEELDKENQ
ncbi:MAG: right-handed parallel beta-helix repeat-containing protein [Pseudomonadota bacterium]